ncbi:acyl carrier protein [Saccharothrix longispora]|uniref:acyl carrier protein n=1 Tax=Saccharothrix longispora TaxID=33920 RepID=UPI0028FD59DA|nr:acyl carrier protein [Saccharothrix longispora]MBY8852839.1 acyl carrier protein [Saccharothrix sp. MB29]MDU0289573.1 acyl carrier protein [Saccharothrix longispora]
MDVYAELADFLATAIDERVGPDDDYFALGLANSLFALELVSFVEQRFHLTISVDDLDLDHFRTLNRLTDFVHAKTAA